MHYEDKGDGPGDPVPARGIADSRMWEPQWASFAEGRRLVRCDLEGFGQTPIEGSTLTMRATRSTCWKRSACRRRRSSAPRWAVAWRWRSRSPARISCDTLVLVCSGLPGHDWSATVREYGAAEEEAVGRGDLDAAVELNLRMWVDGPHRAAADVDPGVRSAVAEMQRRALELQVPNWEDVDEDAAGAGRRRRLR